MMVEKVKLFYFVSFHGMLLMCLKLHIFSCQNILLIFSCQNILKLCVFYCKLFLVVLNRVLIEFARLCVVLGMFKLKTRSIVKMRESDAKQ
ncbi:hypothetical protein HanRHA438_Chr16g0749261 [Helianthus annuus]|nr:hypothetical protein HanRHA438_Chr16g0749261 [Helianthus annuus]